jgi:lysophospholipase L1-like esterase
MKLFWIFTALFLVACGDDSSSPAGGSDTIFDVAEADAGADAAMQFEPVFLDCADDTTEYAFLGTVFEDTDDRADSEYAQTGGPAMADVPVQITTTDAVFSGTTCADGTFRVRSGVSPFFVDVQPANRVTSVNDTEFLGPALASGELNMVVFGDSIPVYGPTPWFPNVLREKLVNFGGVSLENVAVPGSRSIDWVPGSTYFESRLRPKLVDTDLIVFSLGGNDLQEFAGSLDAESIAARIGELTPLVAEIEVNLALIIAKVHEIAPNADVVWILYPNYATSDYWGTILGQYQSAGITLLRNQLNGVRRVMAEEDIVMIDILEATADEDLNVLLSDALHLSVIGHKFYAAEIFKTLGGVETDAEIVVRGFAVSP